MAIVLVNSTPNEAAVNAANIAASFASLPTPGNILIAFIGHYHATTGHTVTVDDNQDHGWAQAVVKVVNPASDDLIAEIWWKVVGTSSGTYTVTVTPSAGNFWAALAILEYSGLATTPVDKTAVGGDTSGATVASGTTATTTQADELLAAAMSLYGSNTAAMGITGSWTEEIVVTGAWGTAGKQVFSGVDRIVSATGGYAHTWTPDHSDYGAACIATFKEAGAPPPPADFDLIVIGRPMDASRA